MNRSSLWVVAAAAWISTSACTRGRCCPPATPLPVAGTAVPGAPVPSVPAASPIPFRTSGFLADYGRLVPAPRPGAWVWMKDGIDLRAYDNVRFEPIELRFAAGTLAAAATDEQRAKVTTGFTKILTERLAPYFPVLDAPAPATLAVRLALTEIHPSVAGADGAAAEVGGATLEGELRDAETGELFVTFVSRIEGSTRGTEAKEEWRPVEGAFREWADRLLDFLELHAR